MARVLNWVPNYYYHPQAKEAGAGERRNNSTHKTAVKLEFGRGVGRAAGLYRAYERRADPNWRQREDRKEEAKEEADEEARTAAHQAAEAARRARQQQGRKDQGNGQRDGRGENEEGQQAGPSGEGAAGGNGSSSRRDKEERRRRRQECKPPIDFDTLRAASWAEYEATFAAFKERAIATGSFRVVDVPLPPKGMVIEPADSQEVWHKHMLKASLRWHPDKWSRFMSMLSDPFEIEQLKALTEGMFRSVSRAKERGYGFTRFPARSASMWAERD